MIEDDDVDYDDVDYSEDEDDFIVQGVLSEDEDLACDRCGCICDEILCPTCASNQVIRQFDFTEPLNSEEKLLVRWLQDRGVSWYEANSFLRSVADLATMGKYPESLP